MNVMNNTFSKKFLDNIIKANEKYYLVQQKFIQKQSLQSNTLFDPIKLSKIFMDIAFKITTDPQKFFSYQMELAELQLKLVNNVVSRSLNNEEKSLYLPGEKDRRFKNEAWQNNSIYNYMLQSYLMMTNWLIKIVGENITTDLESKKILFFLKQFTDAISPSNFLFTNPEVLKELVESEGESLVRGLEKLLQDIDNSKGLLKINQTDASQFIIGENIACTKGDVVFQNDFIQLIRYLPTTSTVFSIPILITPPWINKYYILDLSSKNSMVKWLVDQGYEVYMISWVNPGQEMANKNFEDYIKDGSLAAIEFITNKHKSKKVNLMSYCIGGTLTACTLSYLNKINKENLVNSSTFLTTLIDFKDSGDLSFLIDNDMIETVSAHTQKEGFLDGEEMNLAFSLLRANDMIWHFFTSNYLLGKDPLNFDILYWNSDGSRLPAAMHKFYLENMYKNNLLKDKNGISLLGQPIDISNIKIPTYFLSAQEDHIVNWQATYKATDIIKSPLRFVLTGSGHVAGVINHPDANKYFYYINEELPATSTEWLDKATKLNGSWWDDWNKWCSKHSSEKIKPLTLKEMNLKSIEPAPGSYVKEK